MRDMPAKVVLTPAWWDGGQRHIGYTDGVDTYCCSATRCWFVRVPSVGYEGYFNVSDLTEIEPEKIGREQLHSPFQKAFADAAGKVDFYWFG